MVVSFDHGRWHGGIAIFMSMKRRRKGLDEKALEAVNQFRVKPIWVNGVSWTMKGKLRVNFRLDLCRRYVAINVHKWVPIRPPPPPPCGALCSTQGTGPRKGQHRRKGRNRQPMGARAALALCLSTHGSHGMHEHPNTVLVFLTNADLKVTNMDGNPCTEEVHQVGADGWLRIMGYRIRHSEINLSDRPAEIVLVELKPQPPHQPSTVNLDPVKLDAEHHTVPFENERVRVLRTVLEPHIKSPVHEHPHYVVVYLTDLHTTMKLCTAEWGWCRITPRPELGSEDRMARRVQPPDREYRRATGGRDSGRIEVIQKNMEHGVAVECSVDIQADCREVFDVIHDYGIRLRWDTLLSKASIIDGSAQAGVGVRTLCGGSKFRSRLGHGDRPHQIRSSTGRGGKDETRAHGS